MVHVKRVESYLKAVVRKSARRVVPREEAPPSRRMRAEDAARPRCVAVSPRSEFREAPVGETGEVSYVYHRTQNWFLSKGV